MNHSSDPVSGATPHNARAGRALPELSGDNLASPKKPMKDSPDETGNIPGRVAYLKALNHLRPEVLRELRDEVAPKFSHLWKDIPEFQSNTMNLNRITRLVSIEDKMRSDGSMLILRRWARGFAIRDKWIFDAAVDTILWHHEIGFRAQEQKRKVWQYPSGPPDESKLI